MNNILAVALGLATMTAGMFAGHYLGDRGHVDYVGVRAAIDPGMSEESMSLITQAGIADCLVGESRQMLAALTLGLRSSGGQDRTIHDDDRTDRLIEAVSNNVHAVEAWADTARWAAADGVVTAEEREVLMEADSYLAATDAAAYDAAMAGVYSMPDIATAGLLATFLAAGAETECY